MASKRLSKYGVNPDEPNFEPTNEPAEQTPQEGQDVVSPGGVGVDGIAPDPAQAQPAPVAEKPKEPEGPKEAAFESERLMLFGKPQTQRTILKFAIGGFVAIGVLYYVIAHEEKGFHWVPLIFTAVFGGLAGMLVGQIALVFKRMVFWICAGLLIAASEGGWALFLQDRNEAHSTIFSGVVAIFFLAGFIGFWVGFIFYQKQLRRQERFQQRYSQMLEENKNEEQRP